MGPLSRHYTLSPWRLASGRYQIDWGGSPWNSRLAGSKRPSTLDSEKIPPSQNAQGLPMVQLDHDLVLNIYRSAREPRAWQQTLDLVCRRLKVRSAVLQRIRFRPVENEHGLAGPGFVFGGIRVLPCSFGGGPSQSKNELCQFRVGTLGRPDLDRGETRTLPCRTPCGEGFQEELREVGLGHFICADFLLRPQDNISLVLASTSRPSVWVQCGRKGADPQSGSTRAPIHPVV